jgi:hypothetical protein
MALRRTKSKILFEHRWAESSGFQPPPRVQNGGTTLFIIDLKSYFTARQDPSHTQRAGAAPQQ